MSVSSVRLYDGAARGEQNKHTAGDRGPNTVYLEKSETIIA